MARLQKVSIAFDFDTLLIYARRCSAPNAKYNGISKSYKSPAAEADAFVAQSDKLMREAGRSGIVWIDFRPVVLGMPVTAAPVPVDTPAVQPLI